MLGLAGLQVRLLGQRNGLGRRRRTAVCVAELARQLALPDDDVGSPARPRLAELAIDADDLADGSFLPIEVGPLAELHSEDFD